MAQEPQVEEITGSEGGIETAGSAGGHKPNALVPILVVVIMLPVLSFLMTEFVLIPRMAKALGAEAKAEEAGKHAEGGAEAGAKGPMQQAVFDDIVANISGTVQSRYIKVSFTVEGHAEHFPELVEGNRAKLRDATLSILSTLTMRDLDKPGVKNVVRSDLLSAFETAMGGKVIENLYFSDFVVQ